MNWVKKLWIKNFKGVYSRDNLLEISSCGVLNLDDSSGEGTHWVCWTSLRKKTFYFDPYGLPPPEEFRSEVLISYNDIQYQHKLSVLCGYFCLFVLKQIQDYDWYDVLYNQLHPNDRIYNEKLIMSYFKKHV